MDEKKECMSLRQMAEEYFNGAMLSEISRKHEIPRKKVRKLLEDCGVDFSIGRCKNCGKLFERKAAYQRYCHNPCLFSEKRKFNVEKWKTLLIMRSQIWALAKSNPLKVLELELSMREKEGDEFTDLVFGNILESDDFKRWKEIYLKYGGKND